MSCPTIAFDFDGVIHSYRSGWRGADQTPDPVVPGIKEVIDELRTGYRVVVVSTRCAKTEGTLAVRRYLAENGIEVDDVTAEKPPAFCYIDDRAICFDGDAARIPERVRNFKTWLEISADEQNDLPVNHLRPCEAKEFIPYEGSGSVIRGRFHGWEDSLAIVEADNGQIFRALPESVRFLDRVKASDIRRDAR